ncbi:hypothetical protein RB195_017544 [Necator americanus]|uniref:Serpentine receptor class gamma n=1 Tax=Necator americanus TaxID=51031 RepID=A0ABR1C7L8_NECAM
MSSVFEQNFSSPEPPMSAMNSGSADNVVPERNADVDGNAPADMVQVAASLLTFRFPVAGWGAVLDKPYIAKMGFVFSQYACLLELFAQLSLSVNRFTAICFPLRHNRWWTLTRTLKLFAICSLLALIPTAMRLPQEAGYIAVQGKIVPYLIHEEDQKTNSYVSSCIYVFFGLFCFVLNVFSLIKHSQQRNLKLFDQQQALTRRLQLNLLVYSSSFTLAIISMTVCQCLLALDIFPLKTDGHALLIIVLTLSADYFALSNPWLLLALSASFRAKFLKSTTVGVKNPICATI